MSIPFINPMATAIVQPTIDAFRGEFFGWSVLVLVSASELEGEMRRGENDESSNENLGVSVRKQIL